MNEEMVGVGDIERNGEMQGKRMVSNGVGYKEVVLPMVTEFVPPIVQEERKVDTWEKES
jgi:hypothetical protein